MEKRIPGSGEDPGAGWVHAKIFRTTHAGTEDGAERFGGEVDGVKAVAVDAGDDQTVMSGIVFQAARSERRGQVWEIEERRHRVHRQDDSRCTVIPTRNIESAADSRDARLGDEAREGGQITVSSHGGAVAEQVAVDVDREDIPVVKFDVGGDVGMETGGGKWGWSLPCKKSAGWPGRVPCWRFRYRQANRRRKWRGNNIPRRAGWQRGPAQWRRRVRARR